MNTIRRSCYIIGFLAAALGAPRLAHATGETCQNDIDCKTGPACGGEVCDYNKGAICEPATAAGSGMEGWCTVDSDCKCASEGAKCVQAYCSKTVDSSAAGGAGCGTGGSSGTAGGTSSTAGATSSAGTSSTTGPTSSAGATSSSSGSSDSSGGCSISERAPKNSLAAFVGAACAAAWVSARRRRRAA